MGVTDDPPTSRRVRSGLGVSDEDQCVTNKSECKPACFFPLDAWLAIHRTATGYTPAGPGKR